jgi:hypothetical protein
MIQEIVNRDLNDPKWKYFYLPSLVLLIASYIVAIYNFATHAEYYPLVSNEEEQLLYENHVGNITMIESQPNPILLGIHLFAALAWACGTVLQKYILNKMRNKITEKRLRELHSVIGHALCLIALSGLFVGFLIAYYSQSPRSMRNFLLILPFIMSPLVIMTFYSGKKKDILTHRFWANTAFVGVCMGSFYAEVFIFVLSRYTPFGVRSGELIGTAIGSCFLVFSVMIPSWIDNRATRKALSFSKKQ